MGTDVFISYSRKDSDVVKSLTKALDKAHISYFIDREDISGGEQFIEVITKQILSCKVFVFIGSSNSYESKWTMKEVAYAFQEKDEQNIIPIIIDNSPVPGKLQFLFSDVNVLSMTRANDFEKVIEGLLLMLGHRRSTPLIFSDFFINWRKHPYEPTDEYLLSTFLEYFGPIEKFDPFATSYYKRCLSSINIPYEIPIPNASWATNYDWDFLKRLILASYTDMEHPVCDYSFVLTKKWKLNPQSTPQVNLRIDNLNSYSVDTMLSEIEESKIIKIQEVLLKELTDAILRWEFPDLRETLEREQDIALANLQNEISKISKAVFHERTKHFDDIGGFHEERAKVYKDYDIGFIDPSGKLITPVQWEDASDFCEGLACVADPETGEYGFIDTEGEVVIPFQWFAAHPFKNGKAKVADEDGNWYTIDKEGNIID